MAGTKKAAIQIYNVNAEINLEFINHAVSSLLKILPSYLTLFSVIHFTIDPGNVTVALNQMWNVTFRCSLSDPSLRSHWIVKLPDTQNLSTRDNSHMLVLAQRGVIYDSSSVTVPGVLMNNGTLVRCAAVVFSAGGVTKLSDPVRLIIAGEPI